MLNRGTNAGRPTPGFTFYTKARAPRHDNFFFEAPQSLALTWALLMAPLLGLPSRTVPRTEVLLLLLLSKEALSSSWPKGPSSRGLASAPYPIRSQGPSFVGGRPALPLPQSGMEDQNLPPLPHLPPLAPVADSKARAEVPAPTHLPAPSPLPQPLYSLPAFGFSRQKGALALKARRACLDLSYKIRLAPKELNRWQASSSLNHTVWSLTRAQWVSAILGPLSTLQQAPSPKLGLNLEPSTTPPSPPFLALRAREQASLARAALHYLDPLTPLTPPHGRWATFTAYDSANRRRRYMMPRYSAPTAKFWYRYDVRLNKTSNPFRFYELYHSDPTLFPDVLV